MISTEEMQQLLDDLRCGKVAPALINLDEDVRQLSPEIDAFISENYAPVHVGKLHARRPPDVTRARPAQPPVLSID